MVGLHTGNISETHWRTASDNIRRSYGYVYDGLDRLSDAWYGIPGSVLNVTDSYNEHVQYDLNGNITTLKRNGDIEDASTVLTIDELTYTYDTVTDKGNKLLSVADATNHPSGFTPSNVPLSQNAYEYDVFGNLIKDRNKGITHISYNHLNQPKEIFVSNETYSGSISYLYDADGNKLQKTVMEGQTQAITDYLGAFQYQDGALDFLPHAEGYVKAVHTGETTEYHYVYNYTDHLGNIRLSYARDPETDEVAILKESHYYPFGLQHKGYVSTHQIFPGFIEAGKVELLPVRNYLDDSYRYTFGGKEEQLELGLNWIDHHARNYDAALGRWMNVDPLAEEMPSWSPYNYAFNNPVFFIDPDGHAPVNIIGVTKDNAKKFKANVHSVLADSKFDNLRGLIDLKGKKFRKIESGVLATALDGVSLSADEQAYVDVLVNTINSDDKHMVEYLSSGDDVSSSGFSSVNSYLNGVQEKFGDALIQSRTDADGKTEYFYNDQTINILGGEGYNVPTKKGSHSFIQGVSGKERAVTSGHEVFGHGIPSASGATPAASNANAIRADNLVRRLLGLPQRSGSNHAGYKEGHIKDPQKLPRTQ